MRRVIISALALALLPAAAFAQEPPVQQPPAQTAPAEPAQPAAPKITFKTPAGMLLVQIKPDQTAAFEELITKLKAALEASTDPTLKAQASIKAFKSADPSGANALYVVLFDPAVSNGEYEFLTLFNKTLTPDQQRDPAMVESFQRWAAAFAGQNLLNLTPVGGGN
jgi:hypothetical protein